LIQHGIVGPLVKNCSDTSSEAGLNALKSLTYLSSTGTAANQCIVDMLEVGGLPRLTELILSLSPSSSSYNNNWRLCINFSLALLANMTRTEQGAIELVGTTLPDEAVTKEQIEIESSTTTATTTATLPKQQPTLVLLLERFLNRNFLLDSVSYVDLKQANQMESHDQDPYQHFAAVLMNMTQVEAGRKFLLRLPETSKVGKNNGTGEPSKSKASSPCCVLETLLGQLRWPNPIRRRGIAGTLRNCCLETGAAWWFLNILRIPSYILYPLAGPEELDLEEKKGMDPDLWLQGPDKERETDVSTRLFLIESILLLCASGRKSRETIRLAKTYVILKYADMVEEEETVSERINECVQYLRRDEHGTAEGSSDEMVATTGRQLLLPPSTSTQIGANGNDDYDNVD
jgi:hypothetical protein